MWFGNANPPGFGDSRFYILPVQWLVLVVFGLCFRPQSHPFFAESWSPSSPFARVVSRMHPHGHSHSHSHSHSHPHGQSHAHPLALQPPRRFEDHFPARASGSATTRCFSAAGGNDNTDTNDSIDNNDNDSDSDEPELIEIESLSASQILELIELSFFQACYALSRGDVGPLKLFVIATKTASRKYPGASGAAISESVDSLLPSVRPLDDRERSLRDVWIRAVYLVLETVVEGLGDGDVDVDGNGDAKVGVDSNTNATANSNSDDEVAATYGPILADLVAVHQTGMGLNANQFVASRRDLLFPRDETKAKTKTNTNILALEPEEEDDDDAEEAVRLAVVTQTINVLYTTLVVLEEEEAVGDDPVAGGSREGEKTNKSPSSGSKKQSNSGSSNKKSRSSSSSSSSSGRGFG